MAVSHGFNLTEATTSVSAPVQVSSGLQIIVGTAPVNQLANPAAAVNTPLYVSTYKEAVAAVGWSSDFAKYTLCEAISANFQVVGAAPIVVINVLDPKIRSTSPPWTKPLCRSMMALLRSTKWAFCWKSWW